MSGKCSIYNFCLQVLRGTQVYSAGYGVAVHAAWEKWSETTVSLESCDSSDSDYDEFTPAWPDACLDNIVAKLGQRNPACPRVW